MTTDLHDLSIAELAGRIAARALSPVELVDALIARVEQHDAQLHAFITPPFELARRQARQAEAEIGAGRAAGPLHGVPFGLKDIYDTAGILTSAHSRVFIDRIPAEDATTTAKLYEAGAVLLGKLATHEMAHAGPSFDLPWPPAQPVESRPLHRRLLHRVGRGGGGGAGAGGARLRHRRLDPRARVALRGRRPHGDLRAGEPRRRHHQLLHIRPLRSPHPHGGGRGDGAAGAGWPRPEGRGQYAPA